MTFHEELTAKVNEIRRLALQKWEDEWERPMAPDGPIPARASHDFAVDLNYACRYFDDYFLAGDPDVFEVMMNGPADPNALHLSGDIRNDPQRESPLDSTYLTVAENVRAVPEGDLLAVQALAGNWAGAPAQFLASVFARYGGDARMGHRQLAFIAELGALASACKSVLDKARTDILKVADSTISKLDNLYSGGMDGSGGAIDFTFVVAGAVASIAGAGPWVGATLSLGSFLTGLSDSAASDESAPEECRIGGDDVATVLSSMMSEINRLSNLIANEKDLIRNALSSDLTAIEGDRIDRFTFVDVELSGDQSQYGRPPSDNIYLVYQDAYTAGRVYLSAAAHHYNAASSRLALCTARHDTAFGQSLIASLKGDFLLLRDTHNGVFVDTGKYFRKSGVTLCNVVAAYAEDDAINADDLMRAADQIAIDNPDLTTMHEVDQQQQDARERDRPGVPV